MKSMKLSTDGWIGQQIHKFPLKSVDFSSGKGFHRICEQKVRVIADFLMGKLVVNAWVK